jgi:hypothetical protein
LSSFERTTNSFTFDSFTLKDNTLSLVQPRLGQPSQATGLTEGVFLSRCVYVSSGADDG